MRLGWIATGLVSGAATLLGCSSGSSGPSSSSGTNASASSGTNSANSGSTGGTSGDQGGSSGSASGASASGSAAAGSGTPGSGASGSSGSTGSDEGGTATIEDGGAASDGTTVSAAYPSGPYCSPSPLDPATQLPTHLSAGCVLPNMSWIGYHDEAADVLATTEPYATYSLSDVFAEAKKSGKKYAMINVAEYDCPGCGESATLLGTANDAGVSEGASVVEAGGVVIELLETSGFSDVASKMDLMNWVTQHSLHVTTVEDPGTAGVTKSPSYAMFGRRDQAYIIDLSTMKILQYIDGNIGPTANGAGNSTGKAMVAMHMLLGK